MNSEPTVTEAGESSQCHMVLAVMAASGGNPHSLLPLLRWSEGSHGKGVRDRIVTTTTKFGSPRRHKEAPYPEDKHPFQQRWGLMATEREVSSTSDENVPTLTVV